MTDIELSGDDFADLFAIVKEEYILDKYLPKPEIDQRDRRWLTRFKQVARQIRSGRPDAELERWPELQIARTATGFLVAVNAESAGALQRGVTAILSAFDETDVHARTGRSKSEYESLVQRVFGV